MKKTILVLLLFLISCASSLPKFKDPWPIASDLMPMRYVFVCDFPEEFKKYAEEGFLYWEEIVGKKIFHKIPFCIQDENEWEGANWIIVTWKDSENSKNPTSLGTALRATENFNKVKITYVKITYWRSWLFSNSFIKSSTARHEVGHALGLHHHSDPKCLMYYKINKHYEIKDACKEEIDIIRKIYAN